MNKMNKFTNPMVDLRVRLHDVPLANPSRRKGRLRRPNEVLFPQDNQWGNGKSPFPLQALRYMRGTRKLRDGIRYPESMQMRRRK